METVIDIDNLSVAIRQKQILRNITVPIYKNKITALIGPSGCGKTTFLRSLNRSVEDDGACVDGRIILEKKDIFQCSRQDVRKEIGLIYQKPSPFPFSVYKNISYALTYHGVGRQEGISPVYKTAPVNMIGAVAPMA